jgi:cytochrome c oxidase cbb3-type subunit III
MHLDKRTRKAVGFKLRKTYCYAKSFMRKWFALVLAAGLALAADDVETGRKLFTGACGACHGQTGEGGRGPKLADGRLIRGEKDEKLADVIRNGVPGADMPGFKLPDAQIKMLVKFLRYLTASAYETQVPGDRAAGEVVFFGKGGCAGCHSIGERGGNLGPDLSDIGASRTPRQIRESILEPSIRPTEGFRGVKAVMSDGRVVEGVARNNTNYSMQILDAAGKLHLLDKRELAEVVFRKGSLMPGDYGARLTKDELQNLLAFLSRQSVRQGEMKK